MARVRIPAIHVRPLATDDRGTSMQKARNRAGVIFMTFAVLYVTLFACSHASAAELRLVVANTNDHRMTTVVLGANDSPAPATVNFDSTQCHNYSTFTVAPGGALQVKTAGLFCAEFLTLPVPNLRAFSLVTFKDGTNANSFVVPPVGSIDPTHSVRISPLVSDDSRSIYVNLIPSKPAPITVEVYDAAGAFVSRESFSAFLPVTQYKVNATPGACSIVVKVGWVGFGVGPPPPDPIYGFVTNASAINSNAVAYPF